MSQYFTDFSEYSTGSPPSDWTEHWNPGVFVVQNDGSTNYLELDTSSNNWHFLVWDAVGDVTDVELYLEFKFTASLSGGDVRMATRFDTDQNTSQGSRHHYIQGFRPDRYGQEKYVNGAYSSITVFGDSVGVTGDLYCVRTRINGSTLGSKFWKKTDSEPTDFAPEDTDTDIPEAGHVGFSNYFAGSAEIHKFTVGTAGDTAPTEPLSDPAVDIPTQDMPSAHVIENIGVSANNFISPDDSTAVHEIDSSSISEEVLLQVNSLNYDSSIDQLEVAFYESFFTDFEEYNRNSVPEDWTRWQENTTDAFLVQNDGQRNYLELSKSSEARDALTWDKIPATTSDIEVYSEFELTSDSPGEARVTARLDPDSNTSFDTAHAYNCGIRIDTELYGFSKYISGSWNSVLRFGLPFSLTTGVRYCQRMRIIGTDLSIKVWEKQNSEPDEFALTTTDSDISEGLVGIHAYDAGTARHYVFSVSVGGGTARKTRIDPFLEVDNTSHNHVTESTSLEGSFYNLSPSKLNTIHEYSESSVSVEYNVSPDDASQSTSIDIATLFESYQLSTDRKLHGHSVESTGLGSTLYDIFPNNLSLTQSIDPSSVIFHTVHNAGELSHAHIAGNASIGTNYSIIAEDSASRHTIGKSLVAKLLFTNGVSHPHEIEQLDYELIYPLEVNDSTHDHGTEPAVFNTTFYIDPEDVLQNGQMDWTRITLYSVHNPDDMPHIFESEDAFLGSVYKISPNNVTQTSSIDIASVGTPVYIISGIDTVSSHLIGDLTLDLYYGITVNNTSHSHNIEQSNLGSGYQVLPNETLHGQESDSSGIDVHFDIGASNDINHLHQNDESTLLGKYALLIEDLLHDKEISPLELTPFYSSGVDSLHHSHSIQRNIITTPGDVHKLTSKVEKIYNIKLSKKRSYNIKVQSKQQYNIKLTEHEV